MSNKARRLLLSPGEWKVFDGVRIENDTKKFKLIYIKVSSYDEEPK